MVPTELTSTGPDPEPIASSAGAPADEGALDGASERADAAASDEGPGASEGGVPSGCDPAAFSEHVREVTQRILDLMGLDLRASVTHADRHVVEIEVSGRQSALIIGKHGQTLEALQHLVGLIASRAPRRRWRVIVDSEGYQRRRREQREQELLAMVRQDAQRAKETGQEAVIEYAIGPYERRLVHMAFKDDPDFITYSEGEEPNRFVVISPRD